MVLTGINSARRSAKSGKSATIRIRLSASGRTMSRNNSKDDRRRNSAGTPIDRRRTNNGAKLKISAAIAKDRRKSSSEDRPKTSNAATTIDRRRTNSENTTSSEGFKGNRMDGGWIRSGKLKTN